MTDGEFEEVENPMYGDADDDLPRSVQLDLWLEDRYGFTPVHTARWTKDVRVSAEYL